jgi:hypothetical protein
MGEKRKHIDTRKEATQCKKMKFVRETTVQALTKYDLDKNLYQVKKEIDEAFERVEKQQKERHSNMQE